MKVRPRKQASEKMPPPHKIQARRTREKGETPPRLPAGWPGVAFGSLFSACWRSKAQHCLHPNCAAPPLWLASQHCSDPCWVQLNQWLASIATPSRKQHTCLSASQRQLLQHARCFFPSLLVAKKRKLRQGDFQDCPSTALAPEPSMVSSTSAVPRAKQLRTC